MVVVGDKIKEFTLNSENGLISLSDYPGKNIVLFFYPKDNTPGWITEVSEFRDLLEEFEKLNVVVLGVSKDSIKSHTNFAKKMNLNFALLSDEDKKLSSYFEVIHEKTLFGKVGLGIERSTFILNEEMILVKEFRKVKPLGHAKEVLEYFKG